MTRADMPGAPRELPPYEPRSFTAMLAEGPFRVDETTVVFGLAHTDSNQHVNSLVYLRLFEEATLRTLSPARPVLARRLEIAYRKPCFAGDRMRVHVKEVQRAEGKLCVVAAIAPEEKPAAEAHAAAWMELE